MQLIRVIASRLVLLSSPSECSDYTHSVSLPPSCFPSLPTLVVAKDNAWSKFPPISIQKFYVSISRTHNYITFSLKNSRPFADSSTSAPHPPKQASDRRTLEFYSRLAPLPRINNLPSTLNSTIKFRLSFNSRAFSVRSQY